MSILLAGIHQINVAGAELKTISGDKGDFKLLSLILNTSAKATEEEDDDFSFADALLGKKTYENTLGLFFPKFDPTAKITEYDATTKRRESRPVVRSDYYKAYSSALTELLTALAPKSFATKVSTTLTKSIFVALQDTLKATAKARLIEKSKTDPTVVVPADDNKQAWQNLIVYEYFEYINESEENYQQMLEALTENAVAAINNFADNGQIQAVWIKLLRKSKEVNYGVLPSINQYAINGFVQAASEPCKLTFTNFERGLDKDGKPMLDKNNNPMVDKSSPLVYESTEVNAEEKAKQEETLNGVFTGFGMTN